MTNSYETNNTGKKTAGFIIGGIAILAIGATALYLIDVDQTEEARLPSVSVNVEDGNLPKFDVDVADVSIGSTEVGVDVPDLDVKTKTIEVEVPVGAEVEMEKETFTMPTIDVDKPREDDPANNPQ